MIDLDRAEAATRVAIDPLIQPDVLALIRELRAARVVVIDARAESSWRTRSLNESLAAYDAVVKEQ